MASVTQRIKQIAQPHGGYLKLVDFEEILFDNDIELKAQENESIHASLTGLAVDYMARLVSGALVEDAFKISLLGAKYINEENRARDLLRQINGLDDNSIACACKLVGYDVCYRSGGIGYKPVDEIIPNQDTIFNIRVMIERSVQFFDEYGPIKKNGFTLEGGYTPQISRGDGDYLTDDTLWDFHVSKGKPNSKKRLQFLIYYIMGMHSVHPEFRAINKLGVYNPRLNAVYLIEVADIAPEILEEISTNIIGYTNRKCAKETEEWTVAVLMARYNVGREKIMKDFIGRGLPYYKKGRQYRFPREAVIDWEIETQRVPYGRRGYIVLPAFAEYRDYLKRELKKAKEEQDEERIKLIKKEMEDHGIAAYEMEPRIIALVIFGIFALIYFFATFLIR